jgi:fermentation-respiration switch protein FrsA (DUF1100 family)
LIVGNSLRGGALDFRVLSDFVRFVVVALIVLVALAAAVRALESRFAFFPSVGESVTPANLGVPYEKALLTTADGVSLRGWSLPHPAPRALIVYFHGNGGNLSAWAPILVAINRQGYAVRAFVYRGYGASTGRPSERGLYKDVDAAVEWAWRAGGPNIPVVYWGRSLGTTMAAYAATSRSPDGLVLEAGFPDARVLMRSSPVMAFLGLFSSYRFPTAGWLTGVRSPVLVMHGDDDHVIPFTAGRALFDKIAGPKRFVTIKGGDHNDAVPPDPTAYWAAVNAFIASLTKN